MKVVLISCPIQGTRIEIIETRSKMKIELDKKNYKADTEPHPFKKFF